jgi:lipopolysaccharide transport system permease protein
VQKRQVVVTMKPESSTRDNDYLAEVVYTSRSQLRNPSQLLHSMFLDLIASRELAWRLFVRNFSAQYRQTFLGYLWAFLPPIISTLTFTFLNSQKIFQVGETAVPYPVYVMIGLLLWQLFVDALNSPIRLVTASKSMLTKINFPREALILTAVYEVLFNFCIRLVLLIVVFLCYQMSVSWTFLLIPLGIVLLLAFGLMIGIALTPLSILYQDIERALGLATYLWFFLTPVIYPPPTSGLAVSLIRLNPVSPLLNTTRDWLTNGRCFIPADFLIIGCFTLFALFLGWIIYRLAMPHLVARMSS